MLDKCAADKCQILCGIGKHFTSTFDLKQVDWQELFQHLSSLTYEECEDHQEKLIYLTLESSLNKKYPVKKAFQLSFLKHCISQAEKHNIEFSKAYELYVKLLSDSTTEDETSYKHYFIGEKIVTLKENNSLISGGTTGLCTWQAAIALANWCLSNDQLTASKRVLELGCGAGLTGIALLNAPIPLAEYTFTDCHPLVLQQLEKNLNINIPGSEWPRKFCSANVNVQEFDWGDTSENNFNAFHGADVILGADIVYDIDLIDLLCAVLQKLLSAKDKCAVIACTVRNQSTIDSFIEAIGRLPLTVTEDKSSYKEVIAQSSSSVVKIYLIKKK